MNGNRTHGQLYLSNFLEERLVCFWINILKQHAGKNFFYDSWKCALPKKRSKGELPHCFWINITFSQWACWKLYIYIYIFKNVVLQTLLYRSSPQLLDGTSLAVHLFHPPPGTMSIIAALLAFTHKFMWLIPRRAQKWSHPQLMNNSVPKQLVPSCVGFACFPVCLRGIPQGLSLSPPTLHKHAARPEWTL